MQQDDVAAQIENYKQLVPLYFEDMQDSIAGMTNADDIENAYKNNKELMEALTATTTDEADMLGVMIKNTSNSAQKGLLETKRAKEQIKKQFKNNGVNEEEQEAKLNEVINGVGENNLVDFVGQLDTDLTAENIQQQISKYLDNKYQVALQGKLDTSRIKSTQEEKGDIQNLFDQYEKAYSSNGGFSEDEAAKIISTNPEYLQYLVKVGDQYKLNKKALVELNEATREQTEAMEQARGVDVDLSKYNDDLNTLKKAYPSVTISDLNGDAGTGMVDKTSAYQSGIDNMKKLNHQLEQGKISNSEFLEGLSESFNVLTQAASDAGTNLEGLMKNSEAFRNYGLALANELGAGLQQANLQFKSGEKSMGDYIDTIKNSAQQTIKLTKAQIG